ncbi:MAG: trypsin-like peptidase domain-containing protein [Verrucomicrobia bacterium]|jgi:S1-C subfamily serine protease|nr:trypsin-like peptidase domain-containing protein [Verrucomicrobiota bacterium]
MKRHHKISIAHRLASLALAGSLMFGFCPLPAVTPEADIRRDAAVAATEQVMPCVVNIATATIVEVPDFYQDLLRQFYGQQTPAQRQEKPYEIGSGVIIDEEGYVLTNLHVLRRASRVQVKLWDGRVYDADPLVAAKQKDVALLKLRAKPGEKFKAIRFAKDDDLLLGETVLALGNPYGLGGSVSRGILSSKNRRHVSGNEPLDVEDWLQTDAAINPGNSGGPLINVRGELIGINVAVYREQLGMGVGFAIPVKQISAALAEFFTPEVANTLWFGARVVQAGTDPLVISAVQNGSPADLAGLRAGQRIVQVNGGTPKDLVDFHRLVTANKNHLAVLQVEQNGERRAVKAQLVPFDDLIRQKLGLVLLNLTSQTAASSPVKPGQGLFIEEIEKHSPADKAQLQRGFLLTAIDDRATGDLISVADILSTKKSGDRVRLAVVVPRRINNSYVEYRPASVTLVAR